MMNFDDDLLTEILIRLPLKSLFRSKCVSKSWHSLISDDYLLKRLPLIKSAILYHTNSDPIYASSTNGKNTLTNSNLNFFPCYQNSTIIDCCNGLLLCYSTFPSIDFHVINPTNHKWITLPKSNKKSLLSILAFDPCYSIEFKVISFTVWLSHGAELQVFSSITGTWVESKVQWGLNTDSMSATMRYFENILYILGYPKYVVCVDMSSMISRRIELPEIARSEGSLAKCSDRLHYIHSDCEGQLRIWMLSDVNKSEWILEHSVNIGTSFWASRSQNLGLNFLCLHPLKQVVYFCLQGKMVSYDLKRERIEEVIEFGKERHVVQIWLFPFSTNLNDCFSYIKW